MSALKTYEFTFVLNLDDFTEDDAEKLFEAGCDDCTPSVSQGVAYLDFDREGKDFFSVVLSAVRDVGKAGFMISRLLGEHDLVRQSDIAKRTGRSKQNVRQLVHGERGPGKFPLPEIKDPRSPRWRWEDVQSWLDKTGIRYASPIGCDSAIVNAALLLTRAPTGKRRRIEKILQEK